MNKLKKSRKKKRKTTRREFLTTAGALAAGTMVASNAFAQELKRRILVKPKVVPRAPQGVAVSKTLTFKQVATMAREQDKAHLAYKVTTPSRRRLSIKQIQNNKPLVVNDIKRIANEIVNQINMGRFTVGDFIAGLDMFNEGMIDPGSVPTNITDAMGNIKTDIVGGYLTSCGGGCYGGGEDDKGWGCGKGCDGGKGYDCGGNCGGDGGNNCGDSCPDKPDDMASSLNPFIDAFINNVPDEFNFLDPAIHTIFSSYSHDIMSQVTSKLIRDAVGIGAPPEEPPPEPGPTRPGGEDELWWK